MPDSDSPAELSAALDGARRRAAAAGHRLPVLIAGGADDCRRQAQALLAGMTGQALAWYGGEAPSQVPQIAPGQARGRLGQALDVLVFDAHQGFDPDAFGALCGTLRAGGLLLLLTPPLETWPARPDPACARIVPAPFGIADAGGRFLQRLVRLIRSELGLMRIEDGRVLRLPALPAPAQAAAPVDDGDCLTADQQQAVAAVIQVAHGHRRRPLVLVADRGRGKSAAFGIAAARLLRDGLERVLVTAPRPAAAEAVFEQAARLLPGAVGSGGRLEWEGRVLEFAAPDALLRKPQQAGLLLVDEAAAIPTPMLSDLLQRHARIAFATTVHGYEGTGQGFSLRFARVLDRRTPGWRRLELRDPVRWQAGDPLEAFVFRALLLDAAAAPGDELAAGRLGPVERLSQDELAADEALLGEVFGLLTLAHYRTRPFDLRQLLDAPGLSVFVLRSNGRVAATALLTTEGGFDADTARAVWLGERRPHGHLLVESLAVHLGLREAPERRAARILRIAVHPALQGQGLGSALLAGIVDWAREAGLDLLGVSFGLTRPLLRFWRRGGFLPVRISVRRGAASGAHSVLLLHPLSPAGEALAGTARERFAVQLPQQLADPLRDLEPRRAAALLCGLSLRDTELTAADLEDLAAFAYGRRACASTLGPLWHLALRALSDPALAARLEPVLRDALLAKLLQKRDWASIGVVCGVRGRAEGEALLRRAVRQVLEAGGMRG
ncbi:GNAT family N-acetyltransferase [Thiohalobacter sp. IOR34]|uniref:tRNA(Met) cytidine acetyltransferase TmcA n=1 Tax=Thiohalobacter sp. IOR34 TaxID=3057176 RepID=UPI0025AF6B5E|nr:GNAT family N-acetyltransferase [Thiohalobacter sp. IOR34]WJW75978.1 GNAT family N-acetyltransferase [Thiohalobacter sp. IOR34]